MKKLLLFGIIFTLITAAASAQQASGDRYRRHQTEQSYGNGEMSRHDMRRFEKERHSRYHDGRMSRRERHRIHRMHRHERRHHHYGRHHRF
jgi:hypothetical protein